MEVPPSAPARWAMAELSESRRPGLCSRRDCAVCRASMIAAARSAVAHGLSVRLGYPSQQLECPRVPARAEPGPLTHWL